LVSDSTVSAQDGSVHVHEPSPTDPVLDASDYLFIPGFINVLLHDSVSSKELASLACGTTTWAILNSHDDAPWILPLPLDFIPSEHVLNYSTLDPLTKSINPWQNLKRSFLDGLKKRSILSLDSETTSSTSDELIKDCLRKFTIDLAKELQLKRKGSLEPGHDADFMALYVGDLKKDFKLSGN
jgi:hypothetical protein